MTTELDRLAEATHAAMITLPAFAELANALQAANELTDSNERDNARAALLDAADSATQSAALAYLAAPSATRERDRRLAWMRKDPRRIAALKRYYKSHIADFVHEHGATYDPRLLARGGSAIVPFALYPRQREMIDFMLARYANGEQGTIVKARDSGASWCAMSMLVSLCLFNDDFAAIIGSALEVKLDQSGAPGTLLAKARMFLNYLPEEFRGGWTLEKYSAHLRVWFPNGSSIQAQAGAQIGRGERASLVVLDEAAHLIDAEKIEEALAATSEVKIYISTPYGPDNMFALKARNEAVPRFDYSYLDDPRKANDPGWKERKIATDGLQRFNREYGCDFLAGTEGQLIPREHLDACIDAHVKLGIEPNGRRFGAFDIGGGGDPSAFCVVQGCLIEQLDSWPSGTNLLSELRKAFAFADKYGLTEFCADAVGIGASIEGDAEVINAERKAKRLPEIRVTSFKGSESPLFPERKAVPGSSIKAKDAYMNRKSQAYAWLQYRAAQTYAAVNGEKIKSTENVLSISSKIKERNQLLAELGQITGEESPTGKLKIDKYGEGFSPNRADSAAMATAPRRRPMNLTEAAVDRFEHMLAIDDLRPMDTSFDVGGDAW
jgi:phage terminase large subunit